MKKITTTLVLIIFSALNIQSQLLTTFQIEDQYPNRAGIVGNGITDLLLLDSTLYVGTGYGLSITRNGGNSWKNYTSNDYHAKGGLSAMAVAYDGTIWIATGYDTTVQEGESLAAGGGLSYLSPSGSEWVYIPQPRDAKEDTTGGKKPTTTHIQNITYDIAVLDTQIWIVSWGGGIRRSLDNGINWEVITTDGKPFSSLDYLNHRGFSALAENGNIWIGTADGISKSSDAGQTWDRFIVRNQDPEPGGLSGSWVIDMDYNVWDQSVWAITLSTGGNEFNSIARTVNGGKSWQNFLTEELSDGTFARDLAFSRNSIYVATEKGVFKSADEGISWYLFPSISDAVSGESLLTNKFYSVASKPVSMDSSFDQLWAGSADGLAITENNGYNWIIFRSFISTRERTDPPVYAYPNPFSPARGNFIRFQYDVKGAGQIKIDIYNFAMEKVFSILKDEQPVSENSFDRSASWDGRDGNGRMVDNGIYFFRAELTGKISWGKIVVIN
jgi:hypothetical protein